MLSPRVEQKGGGATIGTLTARLERGAATWSTMDGLASTIDRLRVVLVTVAAAVALLAAAGAVPQTPAPPASTAPDAERSRLAGLRRDATTLLTRAARADTPADARRAALRDAADRLRALGAEPAAPGAAILARSATALRTAADTVAKLAAAPDQRGDVAPILALLERARVRLEGEVALGLTFEGGYSQSKVKDPVYGGHATGMGPAGPPPTGGAAPTSPVASPVTFEEAASLPVTAFSGGRTKDHILESGGNGIALLDYDGDGRLDVYVVTGAELSASRQRIAHRNALFRNLGGWRFEDVSAKAGVDSAAWGRASARATPTATAASISTSPTGAPTRCFGTRATAPSRTSRRKPASRPAAGARAARSWTRMPTAISISTWRAM